jgi:hypothetical protein
MNEQNIGIAVEGGGVRSLIFSLGFMHGLFRLGIFQNCNYISSVSGGSWATIPLCYSKQDDYKLEELFGHLHDPELLNHNQIENIDDNAIIKQICAFHYSIYPKLLLNIKIWIIKIQQKNVAIARRIFRLVQKSAHIAKVIYEAFGLSIK